MKKPSRILVIESTDAAAGRMAALLEQADYSVSIATSSKDAWAALQRRKFDLIISDLGMPELSGVTLMQRVRRELPEQNGQTPAIAMSQYLREEFKAETLNAGFQSFVIKPAKAERVLLEVRQLLR
ncbi:MAG TPA: response regulator [Planctomycetota bacterium]|nr:response regulator [Planctomycetota bacterium]